MDSSSFCIIMSGGSGTRFWPVSRSKKPKQFLDLFGTGRSLLQMTYDRFVDLMPMENIFIVTNYLYKDLIFEQLPALSPSQVLLEPRPRNTAPCIAWASYRIRQINPDANIVVVPSDHLILKEDEFARVIQKGLEYVKTHPRLLTLGIVPHRVECGYGYIQVKNQDDGDISPVQTFTEKPNLEMAKLFFESGEFLWNSGMFLWNVKTIIEEFQTYMPDISMCFEKEESILGTEEEKEFIEQYFPKLRSISIDYAVMEKSHRVDVLKCDFGWSDVGTWGSFYEVSEKDEQGNAVPNHNVSLYNSKNNIINLPKEKVAVIEGLEGYIVAESDNALLICRMEEEQRIRQYSADIQLKFGESFT